MHEPAGVVEILVQILQNTPILKYSFRIPPPPKMKIVRNLGTLTFQFQNTPPPPPENLNLSRSWHFVTFQFQNTPPPKFKFRQILALCHFSVSEYPPPPPPRKFKLRQILALCHFSVSDYPPPPRKFKLRQILALCHFSVSDYPPLQNLNLGRSSQWETLRVELPHVETLSNPDNYSFFLFLGLTAQRSHRS